MHMLVQLFSLTVQIEIFGGAPNYFYYGSGDREVGHHYKVKNFQEQAYMQNVNLSFVQVGVWSIEDTTGDISCSADMHCGECRPIRYILACCLMLDTRCLMLDTRCLILDA
jgi:hypothetical protein